MILICAIAGCKKEEEPTKGHTLEPTTEEITEPTTNEKHECSFSSEWTSDDESHWHLCSCGEKTEVISHTWNEGTVQVEATEDMEGLMIYSCTVCNQNKEVVIPKLEHTHNYGSKWGSDSSTHWHLCACGSKEDIAVHTWDAGQVSVEPTEEATGLKIYTCTICDEEREIALPKLPHSHKYSSEWKYDETGHWHECSCEVKSLITPHKWDDGEVKLEATEESTGIKLYTCIECGKTKEIEISIPLEWVELVIKHQYSEGVAWANVLKLYVWIVYNNGCISTNKEIAAELNISESTVCSAKNVLTKEFEIITKKNISEKIFDGTFRTLGQIIEPSAWWNNTE